MSNWIIFSHHTPKLGIPVEMVIYLETFVEANISRCAPRLPLVLRNRKLWKGRGWIFFLRLHNPGQKCEADAQVAATLL